MPGGKLGEAIVTGIGILGAVVAMILSFIPPSQINTGSPVVYVLIILIGAAVFFCVPLVVYGCRRPDWRDPAVADKFYPFDWQIENRKPSQVSRWSAGYEPTPAEVSAAVARISKEEGEPADVSGK